MSSKYSLLVVLICTFLLSACSLKLNEPAGHHQQMSVDSTTEGCLSKSGDVLDKFARGKINEDELNIYWSCLEKAVVTFANNTKGKESGYYSPEEFSHFLTKYFLKGKEIPHSLISEVMALKVGFLGGDENRISKAEFEKILAFISVLKDGTHKLLPYMPLIPRHMVSNKFNPQQFEDALLQLQLTMQKTGALFESGKGSYKVSRIVTFATEIESFLYGGPKPDAWTTSLKRWGSALPTAKGLLISQNDEEISPSDWQKIFTLAPRYYGLVLRSKYYLSRGVSHTHSEGLANLERLFDEFYLLLEYSIKSHPSETIRSQEIDKVIEVFHTNKMLPTDLETSKHFLSLIFGRFLNESSQKEYSITLNSIQILRNDFLYATEGFRALQFIFKYYANEKDFLAISLDRPQITTLSEDTLLDATKEKSDISRSAVKSIADDTGLTQLIFPEKSTAIYIPENDSSLKFTYTHMSRVHLFRSINRILYNAYAKDKVILKETEIAQVLKDILPIVSELGMDKDKFETSVTARLIEASLLLPSSDGKKSLTSSEAIELESLLFSTVHQASNIHAEIISKCNTDPQALALVTTVKPDCYRKIFKDSINRFWWHVPGLAKHFSVKSDREQDNYLHDLESFLRKGRGTERFTSGDTKAFVLLPYYIELLYLRFDKNKDGLLDNNEADHAFEVFHPLLAEKTLALKITKREDHYAIYMFLLATQELPQNAKLAYFWRRYISGPKNFKINRTQITKIFQKILSL